MESSDRSSDQSTAADHGETDSLPSNPTIVGIGASAGGLKALKTFFAALPPTTGMSFVVIVHLDPERESSMSEVLQGTTAISVTQVTERVALEPDHVYVIPPSKRLEVTDAHLSVSDFEEPRGKRVPVDHFFRSLAAVHGDGVGIVLSGGGSDGAVGVKAIKEEGGLVLAQDPVEADHDGMPRSAMATGVIDCVMPVREMTMQLVEMVRRPPRLSDDPRGLDEDESDHVRGILEYVRAQTDHDFADYKRSTVLRRLRRRLQVTRTPDLAAYNAYLQDHSEEVQALFRELLIGVTTFFRDPKAFEALREKVIPRLFEGKNSEDVVRVWVVGCSTGEEVYSIAMLLAEHTDGLSRPPRIQMFASDLSEEALRTAREGRYPASIEADVSEERLRKFFVKEEDHHRVKRALRESVMFANHSVLRDPPFSKLDLVSCRNLLIYLEREQHSQIFQIFHYGLRSDGYLFLGEAELRRMEIEGLCLRLMQYRCRLLQGNFDIEEVSGGGMRVMCRFPEENPSLDDSSAAET